MKKFSLFVVMAFWFTGMVANANWRPARHSMNDPVKITVRSIDFFIFPNGEFDFNAHHRRSHHYRRGDFGVRIERDRYGKIRRIGNVYLNYNRYGQISRIGSIFIKYNRRGLVYKIGRKHLHYRRHGYIVTGWRHGIAPGFVSHTTYYYGPDTGYYGNDYPAYNDSYNTDLEAEAYDDNEDYDDSGSASGDYYFKQSNPKKKREKPSFNRRR